MASVPALFAGDMPGPGVQHGREFGAAVGAVPAWIGRLAALGAVAWIGRTLAAVALAG